MVDYTALIGIGSIIAILVGARIIINRLPSRKKPELVPREVMALIVERQELTMAGHFGALGMVIVVVLGVAGFVIANGAIQEAAIAAASTAGAVVCGVAMLIGRRKTYTVHRAEQSDG